MEPLRALYNNNSILDTLARGTRTLTNLTRGWELKSTMARSSASFKSRYPRDKKDIRMPPAVREMFEYPKQHVTEANDSCRNETLSCEHVLSCGHLITTALPDEPCAPNCYSVRNYRPGMVNAFTPAPSKKMRQPISALEFYCDACVEEENEPMVPLEMDSATAEAHREVLRRNVANERCKDEKFRHCYIAIQNSKLPCTPTGRVLNGYAPNEDTHPFNKDVAPQTAELMFLDVDPEPATEPTPEPEPAFAPEQAPKLASQLAPEAEDLDMELVRGKMAKQGKTEVVAEKIKGVNKKGQGSVSMDTSNSDDGFSKVSAEQFNAGGASNASSLLSTGTRLDGGIRKASLKEGENDESVDSPPAYRSRRASRKSRAKRPKRK